MILAFGAGLFPMLPSALEAAVRINEFLADNGGSSTTKAGNAEDWIELYNDSDSAVNLGSWYLTDSATKLKKWQFPDPAWLPPHGYLLVFADSTEVPLVDGELHANFSLSKDGEYLGLVMPDGKTVVSEFAPTFPVQYKDASYGFTPAAEAEWVGSETLLSFSIHTAPARTTTGSGFGALGYSVESGAFRTRFYRMSSAMSSMSAVESALANPSVWMTDRAYPLENNYDVLSFSYNKTLSHFTDSVVIFPGHTSASQDLNNFVIQADTTLYVPEAGNWTFCSGTDDGFTFMISGHGVSFISEHPSPRGYGETYATFNFPVAGLYEFALIYYENTGSAALQLSVAKGDYSSFSNAFRLLGDPAAGIRHAGRIETFLETNLGDSMRGAATRVDAAWSFQAPQTPASGDSVLLYLRASDGFSVSLNGVAVAAQNMPGNLHWNSIATASRGDDVLSWMTFSVPLSAIRSGENTLAITGLSRELLQDAFLIQPRLVYRSGGLVKAYFSEPTPGAENGKPALPPTPLVTVSEPRGYKTAPFTVTLACPEQPAAGIRYTLDGTVPTISNGTLYTGPFTVSKTTVLRAAAPVVGESIRQYTTTVSWLFLDDIGQQGTSTPAGWPSGSKINNQVMSYGMWTDVTVGDRERFSQGMTNAIASISLVTDIGNLLNVQTGIYVNPQNDGRG